jgi:hypothetical protein
MINNDDIKQEQIKELDDLFDLAENVTMSIDLQRQNILNIRIQVTYYYSAICIFGVIAFLTITENLPYSSLGIDPPLLQIFASLSSIVIVFISIISLVRLFIKYRDLIRQLHIEQEIQNEVLDLINDQRSRLRNKGVITTLAGATYNMRIKRLDRTETRKR